MKYIRTKDNIYEIDFSRNETDICYFTTKGWVYKADVIKESDNLEDLFDAYVTYDINNEYEFFTKEELEKTYTLWAMNNRPDLKQALYGAIWTNKGLIYVAKMNKDGEWELI